MTPLRSTQHAIRNVSRYFNATQEAIEIKKRFQQYVLPGIVFQSVLIGGAYATGREIVEYGARYGAMGIWSIVAIGMGFSLIAALAFEFARINRVYDYKGFVKRLIGPLWPVFDVVYVMMVIVTIAVVSAASGRVVEEVLGLSYWVGVGLVIVVVGALMAGGRSIIERFKTVGSVLLYVGFVVFAGLVLSQTWGNVETVFATGDVSYEGSVSLGAVLFTGILYVGYNLGVMPATLFVLDYQTTRRQTVCAGIIAGVLGTAPFILTYLAVLGSYPDPEVLDAPVPWLVMLGKVGGAGLVSVYAVVILWTLVETSTGMIHAVIHRIDANLEDLGRPVLTPLQAGILTVVVLIVAAILSRVGLIALVAKGYGAMAYAFLLLFALPLLTIGVVRIWRAKK